MSTSTFKTISLQEFYSLLLSYKAVLVSCFSQSGQCGLSVRLPVRGLVYHGETPTPYLIYDNGIINFIFQQRTVSVTAPAVQNDSPVLTVQADGITYRFTLL